MKQDDKLYNEWLDEVRNVQPILSNPDELTTAILQQVSRIVPRKKKRKSLLDRKSTRLNSSHWNKSRMPSSS